jgi:hypothetical protein
MSDPGDSRNKRKCMSVGRLLNDFHSAIKAEHLPNLFININALVVEIPITKTANPKKL